MYDIRYKTLDDDIKALNTEHWLTNVTKNLKSTDNILISGDLILDSSTLSLTTSGLKLTAGPLTFNQNSQVSISGNLVLNNSNIINDGLLSVSGGIILLGTSTISGSGIII